MNWGHSKAALRSAESAEIFGFTSLDAYSGRLEWFVLVNASKMVSKSPKVGLTNLVRRAVGVMGAWAIAAAVAAMLWASLAREVRAADGASIFASVARRTPSDSGVLKLLTYNVAGVPDFVSTSNPANNTWQVGRLLNHYDVVLAQEDFVYHDQLLEGARHRYRSSPRYPRSAVLGDGLAIFSKFPMRSDSRVRWNECNGYLLALSDCLAEKGFAASQLTLSRKVSIPLINLHADAGAAEGDVQARRDGFEQLASFLVSGYPGSALIVAGDTNLDDTDPRDVAILESFLKKTGLKEVCREFQCEGQNLDRVFYRSSPRITLRPVGWYADARFVDEHGRALSDHLAMAADFSWQSRVR